LAGDQAAILPRLIRFREVGFCLVPHFESKCGTADTSSAAVHSDAAFPQAAISGLFAALRARHDADRSVGKVAGFLALPQ
jgi:hypothetical protein